MTVTPTASAQPDTERTDTERLGTVALLRCVARLVPSVRTGLAATLAFAALAAVGRIVVPVVVQYTIDHGLLTPVTYEERTRIVVSCALSGMVAVLVAGIGSSLMNRRLISTVEDVVSALRIRVLDHTLRLPPTRLESGAQGSFVARSTDDLDAVTVFAQGGGMTLVQNLTQMTIAFVVMAVYSWPLAILAALVACVVPLVGRYVQRIIAGRFDVVRSRIGQLYAAFAETLTGIDTIRAADAVDRVRTRLHSRIDGTADAQVRTLLPMSASFSVGQSIDTLITIVVMCGGVALGLGTSGVGSSITVGTVVAFVFLVTFFVRPLQFAVNTLADAKNSEAGLRRVLAVLDLETDTVSDEVATPLRPGMFDVGIDDVEVGYVPGRPVLTGLDLRIRAGQQVAVVGETGSGKSTFAKLLTRQLHPTTGTVRFAGIDVATIDDGSLARRVAVVPQDPFLFDRSVLENIAIARPGADRHDVEAILAELGLDDWARDLPHGLDTRTGQRGESLSVGERQLVALARTALVDPDLLVLDEATSGVDAGTDVRLQRALTSIGRGRTTVTIAHRLHSARVADRILVFDRGRIVEDGTHDELVATGGLYARLQDAWSFRSTLV